MLRGFRSWHCAMSEPVQLFILAGEPSGDRIAADLVRRLRQRVALHITGVGGEELEGQGLRSLFPMSDLSVMGITDVLKRLPLLLWRVEQTARAILRAKPAVVVLVDAQEFSMRVARRLKAFGFRQPVLLYVSPSVWARHPERARKLQPLFNEVLAVLPFEPKVMRELGGPPTSYVGHPSLTEALVERHQADGGLVALLPGSREGELRRHLSMFRQVAEVLAARGDAQGFVLPTLPAFAARLEEEVRGWDAEVTVVTDRAERLKLYQDCRLAICCAGTATLELAMAGVPMIVTYVMDGPQIRGFNKLGRPRVGLPNIILDADLTPEIIIETPSAAQLLPAVAELMDHADLRQVQMDGFVRLRSLMHDGTPDAPRQDPAERVLAHLPPELPQK